MAVACILDLSSIMLSVKHAAHSFCFLEIAFLLKDRVSACCKQKEMMAHTSNSTEEASEVFSAAKISRHLGSSVSKLPIASMPGHHDTEAPKPTLTMQDMESLGRDQTRGLKRARRQRGVNIMKIASHGVDSRNDVADNSE